MFSTNVESNTSTVSFYAAINVIVFSPSPTLTCVTYLGQPATRQTDMWEEKPVETQSATLSGYTEHQNPPTFTCRRLMWPVVAKQEETVR